MRTTPASIILVEDAPFLRQRLESLFHAHPEIRVVAATGRVADAEALIRTHEPELVVLDLRLEDGTGLALLEAARRWARRPAFLVLSSFDDEEHRARCLALGAARVLDKAHDMDRVLGVAVELLGLAPVARAGASATDTLFELAMEGMAVLTSGGVVVRANRALAQLLGREQVEALVGGDLADLVYRDAVDREWFLRRLQRPGMRYRSLWRRGDGRPVVASFRTWPVVLADGSAGVGLFAADETERMELEAQLRRAQRLETVAQFASGIAHDLNNIMGAITAHVDLLQQGLVDAGMPVPVDVGELRGATARATSILRRMLRYANGKGAVARRLLDVGLVVRDLGPLLTALMPSHVRVRLHVVPDAPRVHADETAIEQLVMNLVVNARDALATAPRGGIDVEVRAATASELAIVDLASGPACAIVVRDNGDGIPVDAQGAIFEPFVSSKATGSGLGLYMVRALTRQHGGDVQCASQPGAGATFTVVIPGMAAALLTPALGSQDVLRLEA